MSAEKNDGEYLSARRVLNRYGISQMSLHRWLNDPEKRFPKPMYIGRRRYWKRAELEAWEHQCVVASSEAA